MKEHNHPKPQPQCKHVGTLKYCDKCEVVYCTKCGEEFKKGTAINWEDIYRDRKENIQPVPYPFNRDIVLCEHKA